MWGTAAFLFAWRPLFAPRPAALLWAAAGVLFLALAVYPAGKAAAQNQDATELRDMCLSQGLFEAAEMKEKAEGVCWGFIAGLADVMATGTDVAGFVACPQFGSNVLQRGRVIEIVTSYLRENADKLDLPAYVVVAQVIADASPCD